MRQRVATFDWSQNPLGPPEAWPQSLRAAVGICLNSRFPMFVWWGPQLINIYNDAYIPVLGKRHPAALGTSAREIWSEIWNVVGPQADAVMQRGEATWNERVLLVMGRNDYSEDTYFTWSYSPIIDDEGQIGGVFCACTEETQRVNAEADRDRLLGELDEQRRLLSDVFERSPAFMAVVRGPTHVFELVNKRYYELVGQRQLVGRSLADALPELAGQGFIELLDRVYASGDVYVGKDRPVMLQRRADAPLEERHVEFVYQPLRNPAGEMDGIFVHGIDLTERHRAENELRNREEHLRQAVAIAKMGTFEIDLRTDAVNANEAGREIYGWAPDEELTFSKVQTFFHPDDRERVVSEVGRAMGPGGSGEFEVEQRIIRRDGAVRWIRVRGRGIPETGQPQSPPVRCVGTYIDITERREAEQRQNQLLDAERAARAAAERASEAKSEFLATLSHELRTPLTPVMLTVSLMETHPGLPSDLRDDVATIRRNVELESRLISDLLDLTRITTGKMQLELQTVDLDQIVLSALSICQRESPARVEIDLVAPHHHVRGDSTRLQQIFWNLINNAFKFTPADRLITIRSSNPTPDTVRVDVIDDGVGIDPPILPRLFNAFEQGEVRTRRQQAGLGLGLAISRKLAEAQGGTIGATSEGRGRGSVFTVEFPTVSAQAPDASGDHPTELPKAPAPLRLLVIEDHEPTLKVMTRLLRGIGYDVTEATSVASAIAATQRERFDLLISDLGLPDGSGLDVMRQLREEYAGRAIALTGYGMESDIAASRSAGFTQHLTKPVDLDHLQRAIVSLSANFQKR